MWLRQFHRSSRAAAPPLLIFPHAGAGASSYRALSKALSEHFSVLLVQYPGRQDRAAEPPARSIAELAAGALAEYLPNSASALPLTLFGHSVGGAIAFEFACAAEQAGVQMARLVVSSVVAPSLIAAQPKHPAADDALLDQLIELGGTSGQILASREVLALSLPALKADYAAIDSYTCPAQTRIEAPITALGGTDDPVVSSSDLYAWRGHTTGDFTVSLFPGGHFYLNDATADLAATIAAASPAPAGRAAR
jgi:surfactin synthase thioesterase subunit